MTTQICCSWTRVAIQTERLRSDATLTQLCRYTFVSAIAFLFDYGALFGFTNFLGVHYLISAGIGFFLGLCVNYILSIRWVFSRRSIESKRVELLIFVLIGVAGLGMNELIIWFFTEIARFHYMVSKIISTVVVYLWNFFARKYSLFR